MFCIYAVTKKIKKKYRGCNNKNTSQVRVGLALFDFRSNFIISKGTVQHIKVDYLKKLWAYHSFCAK